jgi:dTDP-4-amino-4,6-dideoxygalactose transaminase
VGEGGVAVTNDSLYAERIALYRNHAEVTNLKEDQTISIGHNLRMGEIEALLGEFQLSKIDKLVDDRRFFGNYLRNGLQKFSWLIFAEEESYIEHDYYILGMRINYLEFPISREILIEALLAEGMTGIIGEYAQLHKLRSFQGYPRSDMEATETLFNNSFIGVYMCGSDYSVADLDLMIDVFEKITSHKDEIIAK